MNEPSKILLKRIGISILVPCLLLLVLIFSTLSSFGAFISLGPLIPLESVDLDLPLLVFGTPIGLILVVPIIRLIKMAKGRRWMTALWSMLCLGMYLVIGLISIFLTIWSINTFFNPFAEEVPLGIIVICQMVSLLLTVGYYFYFKKVIKPLALKK